MEAKAAVSTTDELFLMGSEERWAQQGWKVSRTGSGVRFVRDGYARVIAQWVGGDWFLVTWEYGTGTGELRQDWRAQVYSRDEVVVETDMTLNAMWR